MRLFLAPLTALVVLTTVKAFLPPYSSVRLNNFRTFPFLSVSKLVKPTTLLRVSSETEEVKIVDKGQAVKENDKDDGFPLPLTEFQKWALRDNLPRYVVSISKGGKRGSKPQLYALWRTMVRDVPELRGYPIEELQAMHSRQMKGENGTGTTTTNETPKVLPLLDYYSFEASGGLSGRVYGIPGVADGTNIVTSAIPYISTVSEGYVQTEDGDATYELGRPADSATKGLLVTNAPAQMRNIGEIAIEEDPDTMLVRLGFLTAVVFSGATAIDMLSHHLTVNVFWV